MMNPKTDSTNEIIANAKLGAGLKHCATEVDTTVGVIWPEGHGKHTAVPTVFAKVPIGQIVQFVLPSALAKPSIQFTHVDFPPMLEVPAMQS